MFLIGLALALPLTHDQAVDDTWELAKVLETSHPDPFLRGGGRVAYYQAVDEVLLGLPDEGLDSVELYRRLLPLVARVGDGHTSLAPPRDNPIPLGLRLTALQDALVVTELDRKGVPLLGMKVEAVNNRSVKELLARQDLLAGSDNAMHRRARLAHTLSTGEGRGPLLGTDAPPVLKLLGIDGATATFTPDPGAKPDKVPGLPPTRWTLPETGPHDIGWALLDDDVAFLRISSMMRYREAFEIWRATGFEGNLGTHLDTVARAAVKKLAKDRNARILQVPSATETFAALFAAMAKSGAHTLVVDLRGNRGGNSAISLVLGLFLTSPEELARLLVEEDGYQIRRFSETFHEAHTNAVRPDGIPLGGYDFRVLHQEISSEEAVASLRSYLEAMPTLATALEADALHSAERPRLKVLVDADTYSAGFDLVRLLDALGAELVGVPSAQSGNCFIDAVPFTLTHSGLRGSLSTKWSVAYPDDPIRGALLPVDRILDWKGWAALDFDPHAVLTLALDP